MEDNINIVGDSVLLNINPELYNLETIYSAAYVFLDRAYIILGGDPKKEIIVKLKPKNNTDLEKLGGDFFNELINYSDYQKRSEKTKKIREAIMQRALITNENIGQGELSDDWLSDFEDDDLLDDPEGIAVPWEEKYGKTEEEENKDE
jgi:His-Xaa-Ser system protein HxsD|tara:strand:- start:8863 stop:9306 length:444 start_codon:yes stop_codon:yes gene_type:complete